MSPPSRMARSATLDGQACRKNSADLSSITNRERAGVAGRWRRRWKLVRSTSRGEPESVPDPLGVLSSEDSESDRGNPTPSARSIAIAGQRRRRCQRRTVASPHRCLPRQRIHRLCAAAGAPRGLRRPAGHRDRRGDRATEPAIIRVRPRTDPGRRIRNTNCSTRRGHLGKACVEREERVGNGRTVVSVRACGVGMWRKLTRTCVSVSGFCDRSLPRASVWRDLYIRCAGQLWSPARERLVQLPPPLQRCKVA